jgi:GNAT superfamily N-acetyltransferase
LAIESSLWKSAAVSLTIEKLEVVPLTRDMWPALEDLFLDGGPCSRCWCMYWRIGAEYRRHKAAENKGAFRRIVEEGPAPGLLALAGDRAVGWCQLTPRADLPWLEHNSRLRPADDLPVWSISCFYVRKDYRRRGVTALLIEAAIEYAKNAGACALEAYPLDRTLSPSSTSTGYVTTFARLGFVEIARRAAPRPIMRYDLAR